MKFFQKKKKKKEVTDPKHLNSSVCVYLFGNLFALCINLIIVKSSYALEICHINDYCNYYYYKCCHPSVMHVCIIYCICFIYVISTIIISSII